MAVPGPLSQAAPPRGFSDGLEVEIPDLGPDLFVPLRGKVAAVARGDDAVGRPLAHAPLPGPGPLAYEEWAQAHEQLQKLEQLGPDLAFGYSPMDEPPEMRYPEAKAEHDAA